MTGRDWSYTDLVREHGEDKALAMLWHMKGYGKASSDIKSFGNKPRDPDERCIVCDTLIVGNTRCPKCR